MSKIAISGAATGTATFTIESPATSTNRTLTLPDNTGTIITQNSTPAFASTIGVGGATAAASGAGITFPATQSASSDANTLDDYEEGTWTPTLPNGGTLTNIGSYYTKIGRTVYVMVHLNNVAPTNNASEFRVGGLPFTSVNLAGFYGGGSFQYVGDSNLNGWMPIISINSTFFYFHIATGASASRTNAQYITAAAGSVDSMIINAWYVTGT